jgi:NAD-dependent SIR2 family protein deacetylase
MEPIKRRIEGADYILIGAGAGLSASGGLSYNDPQVFARLFPELSGQGFNTIWEAVTHYWAVKDDNRLSFWAYWSLHIQKIRYAAPALEVYRDLFKLVKAKPYFVLTTNVDGQFEKAGFDPARRFSPQGDYALFQCRRPCSNDLYPNQERIQRMLANLDRKNFRIRAADIPRCPRCGDYLERNLRVDDTFVEAPHMAAQPAYHAFVN